MSKTINGIRYSYNYDELLEELLSDIEEKFITTDTTINVVRKESSISKDIDYRPIIDFYYPDDIGLIMEPLENLYDRTACTDMEWQQLKQEKKDLLKQYMADKDFFEPTKVADILKEMNEWNGIL